MDKDCVPVQTLVEQETTFGLPFFVHAPNLLTIL
jgi:hypothetical protein